MAGSEGPLATQLAPWLERFRKQARLSIEMSARACELAKDLWVSWYVPSDDVLPVEDVEAMELLELFARVDYTAAWTAMMKTQSMLHYLDEVLSIQPPLYPRYSILNLESALELGVFQQTTARLAFATDPNDSSPGYRAVRVTLLALLEERDGRPFERGAEDKIPIKIDLEMSLLGVPSLAEEMLREISTLTALTQDVARAQLRPAWGAVERPTLSQVFEIAAVDGGVNAIMASDAMLRSLQTIAKAWGVQVSAVRFSAARYAPRSISEQATSMFFRTMLLDLPREKMPTELDLVDDVEVGVFQAACSALLTNQSVRRLSVKLYSSMDEDGWDLRLFWPWLAYALFSVDATNIVDHLDVNLQGFRSEHIEAFESVLLAKDPVACLPTSSSRGYIQPTPERLASTPMVADISPNSLLLLSHSQLDRIHTTNRIETLRIVDDSIDSSYVGVLYPGAGVCWVARDKIIGRRELSASTGHQTGQIKRLSIEIDSRTCLYTLIKLLQLVGAEIEMLRIVGIDEVSLPFKWAESLLAACPKLRRFGLANVKVWDFNWLGRDRPGALLESLALSCVTPQDDVAKCYERLMNAASSRDSRLSDLSIRHDTSVVESLSQEVFTMLDCNRNPERFLLRAITEDEDLSPAFLHAMQPYNGVPLHLQKTPLPLQCKLAMISVVQSRPTSFDEVEETQTVKRPRPGFGAHINKHLRRRGLVELTPELLAAIFRFAAPTKHRVSACM